MNRSFTIATIGGDGIGPEVVDATIPVLETAAGLHQVTLDWDRLPLGADRYLATGETLTDTMFEHLRDDVDGILLGALGDPRVPGNEHARDILLGLRFRLDLYVNYRPCTLLHPDLCPLKPDPATGRSPAIDFAIFRENTEGSYLGRGTARDVGTDREEQIVEEVHTAPKVERILRAGFSWAVEHRHSRVTVVDKANAIPGHRIWRRIAGEVHRDYPDLELEFYYVDALAMELVRDPVRFEVIITSNLFGDILSDLGSQLIGGLGVAASGNLHPGRPGLFEPVHGSAPPLAGTGRANPLATMLTGAIMLDELGVPEAADAVRTAVAAALDAGHTTPDLGGSCTTHDVATWILDHLTP